MGCVCDPVTLNGNPYVQFIGDFFGLCVYGTRDILGFFFGLCNLFSWLLVNGPQLYRTCIFGMRGEKLIISPVMLTLWVLGDLTGVFGLALSGTGGVLLLSQLYYLSMDVMLTCQFIYFEKIRNVDRHDEEGVQSEMDQISTPNCPNQDAVKNLQVKSRSLHHETIQEEPDNIEEDDSFDGQYGPKNESTISQKPGNIPQKQPSAGYHTPYNGALSSPQSRIGYTTPQFGISTRSQVDMPSQLSLISPTSPATFDQTPLPSPAVLPHFTTKYSKNERKFEIINNIQSYYIHAKALLTTIIMIITAGIAVYYAYSTTMPLILPKTVVQMSIKSFDTSNISEFASLADEYTKEITLCSGGEVSTSQFVISTVLGWLCFIIYAPSRIPQIIRIHKSKSVAGLTPLFVVVPLIANTFYLLSVFLPYARYYNTNGYTTAAFWATQFPYPFFTIIGMITGSIILSQMYKYGGFSTTPLPLPLEGDIEGENVVISINIDSSAYSPQIDETDVNPDRIVGAEDDLYPQSPKFSDNSDKMSLRSIKTTLGQIIRDQTTVSSVRVPPGMVPSPSNLSFMHPSGSFMHVPSFQRSQQSLFRGNTNAK